MKTFCAPAIGGPQNGRILRQLITIEHVLIPYAAGMKETTIEGIKVRMPVIGYHKYNLDHVRRAWIYEDENLSQG
jgi:hypothetical protein